MSIKHRAMTLSVAAVLAFGLAACGGYNNKGGMGFGSQVEETAVYKVKVDKPYEGFEARSAEEMEEYAGHAIKVGKQLVSNKKDDTEESELAAKVDDDFNKANDAYREGDYAAAEATYRTVLEEYPLHYGANVNLTLAQLQIEQPGEALKQSLLCIYLFPGQDAPQLNVQAAGAACGFGVNAIEQAIDEVAAAASQGSAGGRAELTEEYMDYYTYNTLWVRMESELHDAATGANADAKTEEDKDGAADDGSTAEDAEPEDTSSARKTYAEIKGALDYLMEKSPDDADAPALQAYLYAVGLQLGFEVDPSLMEPMTSMPFVAADDDTCKIRVTELAKDEDAWTAVLEVENKTDNALEFKALDDSWTINGAQATKKTDGRVVQSGDTTEMRLPLSKEIDPEVIAAIERAVNELEDSDVVISTEDDKTTAGDDKTTAGDDKTTAGDDKTTTEDNKTDAGDDAGADASSDTDDDNEIASFSCVITLSDVTSKDEMARYPISWKAAK